MRLVHWTRRRRARGPQEIPDETKPDAELSRPPSPPRVGGLAIVRLGFVGSGARIRTTIQGFKVPCPTIERHRIGVATLAGKALRNQLSDPKISMARAVCQRQRGHDDISKAAAPPAKHPPDQPRSARIRRPASRPCRMQSGSPTPRRPAPARYTPGKFSSSRSIPAIRC